MWLQMKVQQVLQTLTPDLMCILMMAGHLLRYAPLHLFFVHATRGQSCHKGSLVVLTKMRQGCRYTWDRFMIIAGPLQVVSAADCQ